MPNQTSYKFIAMQRSGSDPYLGGGNITIEGHKSDDNHEWQKATTYYSGTKFIKFRDKLVGKWSDWEKVVFSSDLASKEITPTITANTNYTINSIKAIKKANICFVTVEFTCNKSQPGNEYVPMAIGLPGSEIALYDSNGVEGTAVLLYVDSNGKLIIRNGVVGKVYRITYSYPCK